MLDKLFSGENVAKKWTLIFLITFTVLLLVAAIADAARMGTSFVDALMNVANTLLPFWGIPLGGVAVSGIINRFYKPKEPPTS